MRQSLRLVLAGAMLSAGGLVLWGPAPNAGADPGDCRFFACDTDDGDVVINPTDPGIPGNPGDVDETSGGGGGTQKCTYQGKSIDCVTEIGTWSAAYGCYLQLAPGGGPPPPNATNPAGGWYYCWSAGPRQAPRTIWVDDPPEDLPSPAQLAQEALERMNLEPIDIGIVPEDQADRLGLVGLPAWMWVENPNGNTFGPITESATAGTLTVTATARADSIVWDMGDGSTITCTTDGTPYEDRFGDSDSPDCGHRYESTSWDQPEHKFTVTATTQWTVEWEGGGQSGIIPIDHTSQTQIRVGELQVLTQ